MKVYEVRDAFGLDNFVQVERPDPVPSPGQVVMKVRSVSINYRDIMMVQGAYNPRQPLPLIPFSDGAGEIVAVGEGVTRVAVGDRVVSCHFQGWLSGKPTREKAGATALGGPLDGVLGEMAVLSEEGVVALPDHLNFDEGAALPGAGVTAWSCLFRHGKLAAGERVLALGTGGVSIFALQFAKMAGAEVIITSSSDEKLERAKGLGASTGINYLENEKWSKNVRSATDGQGVDHVIEVGGVGTLEQSIRSSRLGAHISLVGVLAGREAPLNLTLVLMQDIRIQGVFVGPRESFEAMNRALSQHKMKPVVDKVFAFDEAREAMEHVYAGKHFGKVCIRVA